MVMRTEKPVGSHWTDDQWQAISESGSDLLVAAAAGSGKTAVLVERIINKLTDETDPVEVDRLLIVTFTNAAAQEMKTRIGKALEKELDKNPSSLFLRRQMALLNKAHITTSHAFCMSVVRKYYYHLDIDPAFRVLDQTEMALIREEVMEELFESFYAGEDNHNFFHLVDQYSNDRSDLYLQTLVQKLYDFSRSHPWPEQWLDQLIEEYQSKGKAGIDDYGWWHDARRVIIQEIEGMNCLLEEAERMINAPDGPAPYMENIEFDKALVESLMDSAHSGFEAMEHAFRAAVFSRLKSCKGEQYSEELKEQVKVIRDQVKKKVKAIQGEWFFQSVTDHIRDMDQMADSIEGIVRLVKAFHTRYQMLKRDRSVVDFNDLEHFALEILRAENFLPDQISPSAVAKLYQTQFEEVMVDEYQDTNLVQETILQLVSGKKNGRGHLFMVGDVKQSIYRFRLAEPGLFLSKYRLYRESSDSGIKIDLAKNFRSRKEIIDGTNFIFRQIMDEDVAEMDYDTDAELKQGALYPDTLQPAELIVIQRDKGEKNDVENNEEQEDQLEDLQTAELEALEIGKQIKHLVGDSTETAFQVYDRDLGQNRRIMYRDIVILLRAAYQTSSTMIDVFKQMGIPAHAELSTGYFDAIEVTNMMSLLKTIDNPYQDIPLAGVLRSPIGGLTGEELAAIRLNESDKPFYDAVKLYAQSDRTEGGEKVRVFLEQLSRWRDVAKHVSVAELIWKIYRDTGYYDYVTGLTGGHQRRANLKALYDRAVQYEKTSFRGLFRFLRFIDRMREQGNDLGAARALSEQEDVVRIMTIHKSKGLEYPVVFVAGLNKQFNQMDINGQTLLHKSLGFGTKFIDPDERLRYPTLPYLTMKAKLTEELLAEEMRVLYVALTRAKEKLYMIATVRNFDKWFTRHQHLMEHKDWVIPSYLRRQGKSFFDWVGSALLRHSNAGPFHEMAGVLPEISEVSNDSSKWRVSIKKERDVAQISRIEEEKIDPQMLLDHVGKGKAVPVSTRYQSEINHRLTWNYSHPQSTEYMAKQSVTEIKRQQAYFAEDMGRELAPAYRPPIGERPLFMQREQTLSPAEKGTVLHLFMQQLDFSHVASVEELNAQGNSFVNKELLTQEQLQTIDYSAILSFFQSDIGQRLQKSGNIQRECPFTLVLPAKTAYPDWSGDETECVLVQGVIDCLFEDEGGLVLLDYKTDSLKNRFETDKEAMRYLRESYTMQLRLYRHAIEQIWKRSVSLSGLYAFDRSLFVPLYTN